MDISQLKYMPDAQLAQEVQNPHGMIPSWMALSELTKRQQERQAAPVAVPQGTVAGEVLDSLRASGMQPMGIPGGVPGYACGGVIGSTMKMADGGIVGGLVPQLTPLDPTQYQVQAVDPTFMGMDQAKSQASSMYGPGQDYSPMLQQISHMESQAKQAVPHSKWDTLRDIGLRMAASNENPLVSLAQASLGTIADQRAQKQLALQNQERLLGMKSSLMGQQQARQDHISDAAVRYKELNDQMAENEAARKTAVAEKNTDLAAKLAENANALKIEQSKLQNDLTKNLGDPSFAAAGLQSAKAELLKAQMAGDKDGIAKAQSKIGLMQSALDSDWSQVKRGSDMKLAGELQLEKAKANDAMRLEGARQSGELRKARLMMTGSEDGQVDPSLRDQARTDAIDQVISGRNPQVPRGQSANSYLTAVRQERQAWMKANDITPEQLPEFRAHYKAVSDAMRHVEDTRAMTEGRENAMIQQAPIIQDIANRIKRTGVPAIDEHWVNAKAESGNIDAQALRNMMNTYAFEYANMNAGSGQSTNALREDGKRMFFVGLNNGQLESVFKLAQKEADTRKAGFGQASDRLRGEIGNMVHHGSQGSSSASHNDPLGIR